MHENTMPETHVEFSKLQLHAFIKGEILVEKPFIKKLIFGLKGQRKMKNICHNKGIRTESPN